MSPELQLPRKVTVATMMGAYSSWEGISKRVNELSITPEALGVKNIDLVVYPEYALTAGRGRQVQAVAMPLTGEVDNAIQLLARKARAYVIVPLLLREEAGVISNASVLADRNGFIIGIYRKVHCVAAKHEPTLEGGVTPGQNFPVFTCDFGRVGIQMCWDMSYSDGWGSLAEQRAEIVAVPSASPQTIRPAAIAQLYRYYIVTSTPRDNVSIFSPAGLTLAQRECAGVLVHTIDLSYAVLHWSEDLDEGRLLSMRYGDAIGYIYSSREDTGVFWSNDPKKSIGDMLREVNLETMDEQIVRCQQLRN